jgi:hypothetical protein
LVCHRQRRDITCTACGALWTEQLVGVEGNAGPLCPRCTPAALVAQVMQIEIGLAALQTRPHANVRAAVEKRYDAFRKSP